MSEVYDRYVDTAGNFHYSDMETGHHIIPNTAVGSFSPPQTRKTNADRIRSMTDEELADVIAEGFCSGRIDKCDNYKRCTDCTLDWLKEEVKT